MLNHLLENTLGSVIHGVSAESAQAVQNNVVQWIHGNWQGLRGSASLRPFHSPLQNCSDSADVGIGSMRGGKGTCGSGVGGHGDDEGRSVCRDMSGAVIQLLLEKHVDVNAGKSLW